jgi:hypothetical protein
MRTFEQIMIEQANISMPNGEKWLNSLPDLKDFISACMSESYDDGFIDGRNNLADTISFSL